MRTSAIVGAIGLSLGTAPPAAAEVLFLNGASHVEAYASASVGGQATARGEWAAASVSMTSSSDTQTFSINQGLGGSYSAGLGQAEAEFAGVSKSFTSLAGEIEASESLTALASAFEDMSAEFASPSNATFTFTGDASASLSGVSFTKVSGTLPTTTTVMTRIKTSRKTLRGNKLSGTPSRMPSTTLTEQTTIIARPKSKFSPRAVVSGYVSAEAASDNSYVYTFEVLGDAKETLTVGYTTTAAFDGLVAYELTLVNATTGARIGLPRAIDANADGADFWRLKSTGVYSLIVSEFSDVSAADNFGDASSSGVFEMSFGAGGRSPGNFEMSIAAGDWSPSVFETSVSAAVPELPAWALLLIGLAGLQSARIVWPRAASAKGGGMRKRLRKNLAQLSN